MGSLPDRLPAGVVELRRWRREHLPELMAAVAASLPELQPWMPWAQVLPTAAEQLAVLEAGEAAFDAGRAWEYLVFERDGLGVIGSIGLYPRVGPGGLELGYWVRSDRTGHGIASAATEALGAAAFAHFPDLERIEIHMDIANAASAGVPRKLGYRLEREEPAKILTPGETGRDLVWILDRPFDAGLIGS